MRSNAGQRHEFSFIAWGCSSVGRAVALQAIGQEFESPQLHQTCDRVGPVAQLVRAGDSSIMVPSHRKVRSGRDEFRETLTARLMATLSQAGGTPPEGAETT